MIKMDTLLINPYDENAVKMDLVYKPPSTSCT